MATTYVVCLHKGRGVIGGAFTSLALAQAFVGAKPNCGYEIQTVVEDVNVGQVIGQGGIGQFVSTGPGLTSLGT